MALAFRTATYHSLEDGLNANRIFPGDADETLTNRIVARIYQDALSQANYAMDFHSNVLNSIHFNFVRWREEKAWQDGVAMSQAFGTTTVLSVLKTYGYGFEERLMGLLADVAAADGIPTITIELTATYHWNEPSIRAGIPTLAASTSLSGSAAVGNITITTASIIMATTKKATAPI